MRKFSKESLSIGLFALLSVLLLIKYRNTSGDINLYTQAGKLLLNRQNPYLNSEFANSPAGAVLVYFISLPFPSKTFSIFIQILNVLGLLFFAKFVQKRSPSPYWFLGLIWLALSTPYRALIANVQVSGIVLGLFVSAVFLSKRDHRGVQFFGYILIFTAIELKPQFALPFALIFWINYWNRKLFALSITSFVSFHALLWLNYGKIIELLWIDKVSKYSNKSLLPGPEISPWKFLNHIFDQSSIIRIVSSIILLGLFAAISRLAFKSNENMFLLAAIGPLINPYSHMYDLVVLVLLVGITNKFSLFSKGSALILFIVPPALNQTILITLFLLILSFLLVTYAIKRGNYEFGPYLYSCAVLLAAHMFSAGDIELELSIRLLGLIPILMILFRIPRRLNAKIDHA